MVGYPQDLRNIIYGDDKNDGIINHLKVGTYVVDHTTSSPSLA